MSRWTEGYRTDSSYGLRYQSALAPAHMRMVALLHGVEPSLSADPHYLELGIGEGFSFALHAASTPMRFWGNDFMPDHAAAAARMVAAAGVDAVVLEDSFEALAQRRDLPQFDCIALYGIWSWVNEANRAHILDLIRRQLRPGGLCLVSYNVRPGWAPMAPLRDVIKAFHDRSSDPRLPAEHRMAAAFELVQAMSEAGGGFFEANPAARERLASLRTGQGGGADGLRYLIHELLPDSWHVTSFAEVAQAMTAAKLDFVGSSTLTDILPRFAPPAFAQVLDGLADPVIRELTRDLLNTTAFRTDIFIKGLRRLPPVAQRDRLLALPLVAVVPGRHFTRLSAGEPDQGADQGAAAEPGDQVVETLAGLFTQADWPVLTLGEVVRHPSLRGVDRDLIRDIVMLQVAVGALHTTQDDRAFGLCRPRAAAFNSWVRGAARLGLDLQIQASPLTGGGVSVPAVDLAFLDALAVPEAERVGHVIAALGRQGRAFSDPDGRPLEGDAVAGHLEREQRRFTADRLPMLRRHGIVV